MLIYIPYNKEDNSTRYCMNIIEDKPVSTEECNRYTYHVKKRKQHHEDVSHQGAL